MKASLDDKKDIQSATYDVLSTWLKKQKNRQEAYSILLDSLMKCRMKRLRAELRLWVEEIPVPVSSDGEIAISNNYLKQRYQSQISIKKLNQKEI